MIKSIFQIDTIEMAIFLIILLAIVVWLISSMIRIIREYERVVVFRLGRLLGAKGPGVVFLVPFVDKPKIVDLRLITFDVPKQNIITRDNITVDVDAVVYFRVADAMNAIVKVKEYTLATSLLAQTTLRDVIGQVEFDELLTKREDLNKRLQTILDDTTESWGIKVTSVAIRDAAIPENMQRAIAKQAEAEREKRSRIITAEGELLAAQKMTEAAEIYAKNPSSMRLRELQTWTEIAREKNLIVVTEGNISQAIPGIALSKLSKDKS
jgi:regulator of protease activity HflC (stomatin/prohibitin superfamily)